MIWYIAAGALFVYTAGCYMVMWHWNKKDNGGKYGIGWLLLPLAPLLPFMFVWMGIKKLFKAVFG